MPGWYSSPSPAPVRDTVKIALEEFLKAKGADKLAKLRSAYTEGERKERSIIEALQTMANNGTYVKFENPLKEIEIELKLEPGTSVDNMQSTMSLYNFADGRFLKPSKMNPDDYQVTYFGTPADELFSVKVSDAGSRMKVKGQPSPPYEFGIKGEEYVLRRDEHVGVPIKTENESILPIVRTVVQLTGNSHIAERGTMRKEVVTQFALEQNTGRIYGITLSRCTSQNHSPLVQLELEYVGQFTNFPNPPATDEKTIVKDILDMVELLPKKAKLTPTLQTKYDWLVGRVTEAAREIPKQATTPIVGQEFFGEPLSE